MHRGRRRNRVDPSRRTRAGIFYLGALREIFVISIAAGIVLAALSNAKAVFRLDSLSPEVQTRDRHSNPILNLGIDREKNSLIVHSWPGNVEELNLDTGQSTRRQSPPFLISAAASEVNSTSVLLSQWADDAEVKHEIFIIRDGEVIVTEKFDFGSALTADVHISADGSVAVAISHDGLVAGWDLSTSEPTPWEYHLCRNCQASSLSPDGRRLFVANSDGRMMLCNARTGEPLITTTTFMHLNRNVAWSRDGRRLAMGAQSGDVRIFDTATGQQLWNVKLDLLFARCLTFSEEGNLLAVGGFDKRIRVWDLSKPAEPPIILAGESCLLHNLVFTRGDSVLISGSSDGTIREWSLADRTITRQLR